MLLLVKMALKTPQHDHTVDIKPAVQAELARQAAARGSVIESYVASRWRRQCICLPDSIRSGRKPRPRAFVELSKGGTLGGLTIRQLIVEGRR